MNAIAAKPLDLRNLGVAAISHALPARFAVECGRLPDPPWYVAATEWQAETLAKTECLRAGIQVFLPLVREARDRKGQPTARYVVPAFPGYLFVLPLDGADWRALKRARGVAGVLHEVGDREKPATVPGDVMAWWLTRSINGVIEELSVPPVLPAIEPGTEVTVTHGWLAGHTGIAEWSAAERVSLLLRIMGGERRVTVERRAVEPREGR